MIKPPLAAAILACVPSLGFADSVTVTFWGTFYDGNPKFEVSAGDATLAGEVETAVDIPDDSTNIPNAVDPSDHFTVTLDVDDLANVPAIGISFLNDGYGGGAGTDRNLYVVSAQVNGIDIDLSQFQTEDPGARVLGSGNLRMARKSTVRFAQPPGGWPQPEGDSVPATRQTVNCSDDSANCPAADFVLFSRDVVPLAGSVPNSTLAGLEAMVAQNCTVRVEGWASDVGATELNQRLSQLRAGYLRSLLVSFGLEPDQIETRAGGETTQFGSRIDNQRAVITPLTCGAS